jgi:multicomponent Na+:H+ antiporter subunit D
VVALRQDHLKRRLAYSTIAHLAYIVLGFALLSTEAFDGALLHIVNHGLLKITLFFCAGAIHVHPPRPRQRARRDRPPRMPFTMGAFALASLGLAGLPPMGGFMSKWHLVLGAYDAEAYVFAAVMVGAGLLTAGYLFPIVAPGVLPAPPAPAAEPRRFSPTSCPSRTAGTTVPEHQVSAEPAPDGATLLEARDPLRA